jgi:hypothetical protein
VEDGNCACKDFKFLELDASIGSGIFDVGLFEESGGLLNACAFLNEGAFPVDFFDLFSFKILLDL